MAARKMDVDAAVEQENHPRRRPQQEEARPEQEAAEGEKC